jgi:hypothetical protein
MVILFYTDGHAERHPELNSNDIAPLMEETMTILTPEEIALVEFEIGAPLIVGYDDPRKEAR